ncbi:hypothetical protein Pla52n_51720 [Stieleria varia]|uniref:Uncharacterized protein n=2 Tax=Stieleria varia TaxID=2528005 RepID=A0A5C6AHJ9_9BACT|nr:hypothetical protein Pla52n_51720 [Stieleria varia]
MIAALLLGMLSLTPGCIGVDSQHPLSDPADAVLDTRLNGQWVQTEEKVTIRYQVKAAGGEAPKGLHRMTMTIDKDTASTYFFVTQLGEHRYINMANFETDDAPEKWDPAKVTYYSIFGYELVNENEITLQPLNEKFFEKLVENGELKKRVDKVDLEQLTIDIEPNKDDDSASDPSFELTSDSKTLAKVFTNHAKELWQGKTLRVTRAGTQSAGK